MRADNGCTECRRLKYKGRVGIYELLTIDAGFKRQVARGVDSEALRQYALQAVMRFLRQDGILKIRRGLTSATECRPGTGAAHFFGRHGRFCGGSDDRRHPGQLRNVATKILFYVYAINSFSVAASACSGRSLSSPSAIWRSLISLRANSFSPRMSTKGIPSLLA